MRWAVLLGVLWIGSIVGLVSANAVITCLDKNTCTRVRSVLQNAAEVTEVSQKHPGAREVDFHGNLLDGYVQPTGVQWIKLNLSYNLLTEDMFLRTRNSQLEVVDLTYNRLRTVSVPPSVKDFIAERNQLNTITIKSPSSLVRLMLPKNQIDKLDSFSDMLRLQELDLSCNELTELSFDQLPASLRTLKLARNHIHSISASGPLRSLKYLDLSHNILTSFSAHSNLPSVSNLYLQNNKIVMWMDFSTIANQFQQVNLLNNDWDCKNLENVLKKINRRVIIKGQWPGDSNCRSDTEFICCTTTESPYADRLIKYRKAEFRALQEGTALREGGNSSCSNSEPNPCDGDDALVYTVAGSAANDIKGLLGKNLKELEGVLLTEKKIVDNLTQNVTRLDKENKELEKEHSDLVTYIGRQYKEAFPETDMWTKIDEVKKLQDLFQHYERTSDGLKNQINAEERANQDKFNEVETLQKEIDDLNYQKERLSEDVDKRNATVTAIKSRIDQLQKQLQG